MSLLQIAVDHFSQGRFAEAQRAVMAALAQEPGNAVALNIAGAVARALGDAATAETQWRAALVQRPAFAEVHSNLGVLLLDQGRAAEAEASCRAAVAAAPASPAAAYNLGRALAAQQRTDEAEGCFRRATALDPAYADAWTNLGVMLLDSGRAADAVAALATAAALRPNSPDAHVNHAGALWALGQSAAAIVALRRALTVAPDHLGALVNLSAAAQSEDNLTEAAALMRRALAIEPNLPQLHWTLGAILHRAGNLADAEGSYRAALALAPDDPEALANFGILQRDLGRHDQAEQALRRALELDPGHAGARFSLAIVLLSTGRFAEGWRAYEARSDRRFAERVFAPPDFPFPPWRGEDLKGKSILILREQGAGDEIQCARFVPLLRRRGARRITLMSRPELLPLFAPTLGADRIIVEAGAVEIEAHDYWAFAFTVAGQMCPDEHAIPAEIPYLVADPVRVARWRSRLSGPGFKIGVVWKGAAVHRNDRHRSLPGVATLRPLWDIAGATFFSLQKGGDEGASPLADQPLIDLGPEIADFGDTAAIIAQLDLVITVDTSVAHLAGAMAKPCWVLVPGINADWRWLVGRTDSPWYPGAMRIFRQSTPGDWTKTVADVAVAAHRYFSR